MPQIRVSIPVQAERGVTLPSYETAGSAGMDLRANEAAKMSPGERCLVGTGLRMAIPEGFEGQVRPRSGLALRLGLSMVNTPGTIDSDYRGEVKILLINLGSEVVQIEKGDRIAQLVVAPVARAEWLPMDDLSQTKRGESGFGSTGSE
jgi:dUTP pyrophosphatase